MKKPSQSISRIPAPEEIALAVKQAFDSGKRHAGEKCLRYLVPINHQYFPGCSAITDREFRHEMGELCRFARCFDESLEAHVKANDRMFATRIRTLVYCHILEADFPMLTLINLIRAVKGLDPDWVLRRPSKKPKSHKMTICQYPHNKTDWMKELESGTSVKIGDCLNRLWNNDLRNAFSHSQYSIGTDGRLVMSKYFTGAVGQTAKDASQVGSHSYCYDIIETLYSSATAFLQAFCGEYKKAIGLYQDGMPHQIGPGQCLSWHVEQKVWCTH